MTRSVLLAIFAVLLSPGLARAEVVISEGTPMVGHVHLIASAPEGDLRIVEEVDGADVPISDGSEATPEWSCRNVRVFAAIADEERSEPLTVTTPPCEERLKLGSRPGVAVGEDLRVSVVDRWELGGVSGEICATPPEAVFQCAQFELPPRQDVTHAVFRATVAGRWGISVVSPVGTFLRSVAIDRRRYPGGGPAVLFTGDSMMIATRHALRRQLPDRARVIDDVYVGSGITRPFVIDWTKLPSRQVEAFEPDAAIVSLGISDGRPLGDLECCGTEWIAAYAQRVRAIMRTYTRRGAGSVVWLNNPYSRNPERRPQEVAVNTAVTLAAHGLTRVRVVDLAAVLTPDGIYRRDLGQNGQRVRVRTPDGIHLAPAGARIASRLAMESLRRLGVLGPVR